MSKPDGATRFDLCDCCRHLPAHQDGLCKMCHAAITRNPRFRMTSGELLEEHLCHPLSLAKYDALRQQRKDGAR